MKYIHLTRDLVFEESPGRLIKLASGTLGRILEVQEVDSLIAQSVREKKISILAELERWANRRRFPVQVGSHFCMLREDDFLTFQEEPPKIFTMEGS